VVALHKPLPLMVSEPGSFAQHTIVVRKPQIIADVLTHNPYPAEIRKALETLAQEIAGGRVAPLREPEADASFWLEQWRPYEGCTWLELPWLFAETYFYRRVLEIVQYFRPGPWYHWDPFAVQKRQALAEGLPTLAAFYAALPPSLSAGELFRRWVLRSLWGNRADLSNVEVSRGAHLENGQNADGVLVDHTEHVWRLMADGAVRTLDWATDNCGLELLCDLGMVDMLLSHRLVERVRLHLKPQPYFVSDAMPQDAQATIEALATSEEALLQGLGRRLGEYRRTKSLTLVTDPFWATCLCFTQMPDRVRGLLAEGDLTLLKGDVNYRRLLEDRHWPPETPLERIAGYMPTTVLALRTLKGELIAGLPEGLAERIEREDPDWLINGRRGLVQMVRVGG